MGKRKNRVCRQEHRRSAIKIWNTRAQPSVDVAGNKPVNTAQEEVNVEGRNKQMNDDWHVTPIGDLKEHEESEECWCDPECHYRGLTKIIVHNSMDRREDYETGKRKPN